MAAAFDSEPDADSAMRDLHTDLGLAAGSLQKAMLGGDGTRDVDRYLVAGQIPTGLTVSAGAIIRRHNGRVVAKVAARRT